MNSTAVCKDCETGKFQELAQSIEYTCKSCPLGTFGAEGQSNCSQCYWRGNCGQTWNQSFIIMDDPTSGNRSVFEGDSTTLNDWILGNQTTNCVNISDIRTDERTVISESECRDFAWQIRNFNSSATFENISFNIIHNKSDSRSCFIENNTVTYNMANSPIGITLFCNDGVYW